MKTKSKYNDDQKVLGSIELSDNSEVIFYVANYRGRALAHIRKFVTGDKYTGPTKQGLAFTEHTLDTLVTLLTDFQSGLNALVPREIGRISKEKQIDIVVSLAETKQDGVKLDIREYIQSANYEGPTKKGLRLSLESLPEIILLAQKMKPYLSHRALGQPTLFDVREPGESSNRDVQPNDSDSPPGVPKEYGEFF